MIVLRNILLFVLILGIGRLTALDCAAQITRADALPDVFEGVGITEQLGTVIPTHLTFTNESGEEVALSTFFKAERPLILNFVYHNCPMLCSLILESFTESLREMEWTPGSEFDVLTVSFSATETADLARDQKSRYLNILKKPAAADGWHFLTGSEENIFALAEATGFGFKWIEETKEYAHPAALIFLDEAGTITRYIHGMNYPPNDLRRALVEASEGRVGTTWDRIIMYCYRYDASANSYVLQATKLMRLGGGLTLLVVIVGLLIFWRRERGQQRDRLSDGGERSTLITN